MGSKILIIILVIVFVFVYLGHWYSGESKRNVNYTTERSELIAYQSDLSDKSAESFKTTKPISYWGKHKRVLNIDSYTDSSNYENLNTTPRVKFANNRHERHYDKETGSIVLEKNTRMY